MISPLMRLIPVLVCAILSSSIWAAMPPSEATPVQSKDHSEVSGRLTLAPEAGGPQLLSVTAAGHSGTTRGEPDDNLHAGLPPCDDEGSCTVGLSVSGLGAQLCPTLPGTVGSWVSLAFPVPTNSEWISAVNLTHVQPTLGGHVFMMGDIGGHPNTKDILYAGCDAIRVGTLGEQKYLIDPPILTQSVSWIVVVFSSEASFDIGFNASSPGESGTVRGQGFANLGGDETCESWEDLADFGYGYCYCVSVDIASVPPAACCYPDGSCVDQYGCEASGGVFQGKWPLCSEVDCTPGACCFDDQSCTIDFDTSCANAGGVFQGPNTSCPTFGSCSDPIGACCYDECFAFGCVNTTQSDCENNYDSGVYAGPNTTCASVQYCNNLPKGACCTFSASAGEWGKCLENVSIYTCTYPYGGYWGGTGSTCADIDCPTGACCTSDCADPCVEDITGPDCIAMNGLFAGFDSTCAETSCTSACCKDGQCLEGFLYCECEAIGGTFYYNNNSNTGYTCNQVPPCPPPTGACCNTVLGTCTDNVPVTECGDLVGEVYAGDGSLCADQPCLGGCCLPDGQCLGNETAGECAEQGGTFLGIGVACNLDSCNGACCDQTNTCYETTQPDCNATCGAWHGVGSSCEEVVCPQLCDPKFDCNLGQAYVFPAGTADNFCSPTEPAFPGTALTQTWANLGSCTNPKDFDDAATDTCFGHTLTGLPTNIVAATLTVHVRADIFDLLACNDSINLQANPTNNGFLWSNRLGIGGLACTPVSPNLLGAPWQFGEDQTFCLDLAALPTLSGPVSLLPSMNSTGRLDVYIQDDSEVDYVDLKLITCPPCDGDANDDASVDPLDAGYVLARLGCNVGTGEADCISADTNTDGQVDPLDVGYVLARFGDCL